MSLRLVASCALFCIASLARAELLIDPVRPIKEKQWNFGGSLALSNIDYELKQRAEVKRQIIGLEGHYDFKPKWSAFAQIGLIIKSEYEDLNRNGSGAMIGGGVRRTLYTKDKMTVMGFALANSIVESLRRSGHSDDVKLEVSIVEVEGGAVVNYALDDGLSLYGGGSLMPYSHGDAKLKYGNLFTITDTYDIERSGPLALRGGIQSIIDKQWIVHVALALVGETTIMAGTNYSF